MITYKRTTKVRIFFGSEGRGNAYFFFLDVYGSEYWSR